MRPLRFVVFALVLGACQSAPTPGALCAITADCASPLVCRLGRCRSECAANRDCPIGSVCLLDAMHVGSCSVDVDTRCESGGHACPTGLVCVGDRCANTCATDADCPSDGLCRMAGTTGLLFCFAPGRDDAGVPGDGGGVVDGDVPVDANIAPDAGPVSRTYVIGRLLSGTDLSTGQAYGFDLDMMVGGAATLACTNAADFTSPITGATGIDNQYSIYLGTTGGMSNRDGYDGFVRDAILSGDYVVVIDISDIHSFVDDAMVSVHLVLANTGSPLTANTACTNHTTIPSCILDTSNLCSWRTADSACVAIAAGQSFSSSVDLGVFAGTIHAGRLSFAAPMFPIPLGLGSPQVRMSLGTAQIAARIDATSLTEGEIGGAVSVDDFLTLSSTFISGIDRPTVEMLYLPDLGSDATGDHCANISAGLRFDAVAATLR